MITASHEEYLHFLKLCEIEPALRRLASDIWAKQDPGREVWCANWVWYKEFKPRLKMIVGWDATNPELRTRLAWDSAYRVLYDAVPGGCRNCGCVP